MVIKFYEKAKFMDCILISWVVLSGLIFISTLLSPDGKEESIFDLIFIILLVILIILMIFFYFNTLIIAFQEKAIGWFIAIILIGFCSILYYFVEARRVLQEREGIVKREISIIKCPKCKEKFYTKEDLAIHKKKVHKN